jgi:DNA-binding Xre family transcriptional regulator
VPTVIAIKLRDMMESYRRRTGERLTYAMVAERTGLSRSTIESIASRERYNASLETIERLCEALHCAPGELLALRRNGRKKNK